MPLDKADAVGAKTPARAKLMLQNELEALRKTTASLGNAAAGGGAAEDDDDGVADGADGADGAAALLGELGRPFTFDRDAPCPVTFASGSATKGDLDPLRAYVVSCFGG